MGSIAPYETAHGRRYRVRYRRPDHTEAEKRGFRTKSDAELYLSSVTVSKAMGNFVDPARSRIALGHFADGWFRSKRGTAARIGDI
jgi:hypothetical protein